VKSISAKNDVDESNFKEILQELVEAKKRYEANQMISLVVVSNQLD
jgi:hypothetical protein